jgi:hypothetical protein
VKDIVDKSAYIARNILALESESQTARAHDVKSQWAEWRDTLSPSDKELCIWAFVAAQTPMSDAAMELLKKEKPEIYKVYLRVRGGA